MKRFYMCTVLLAITVFTVGTFTSAVALPDNENKPKLAVFPSHLPGIAGNYTHVIMKAVYDILDESELFDPAYSYYTGDDRYNPRSLPADAGESLWQKKGFFSDYEPVAEKVISKGKELGVNAVVLYSIELVGGGYDRMTAYLFDVATGNVYKRRITDEIKHNFTGEVSEQTLRAKLRELNYTVFYKF